jgi:hypothetical protein
MFSLLQFTFLPKLKGEGELTGEERREEDRGEELGEGKGRKLKRCREKRSVRGGGGTTATPYLVV